MPENSNSFSTRQRATLALLFLGISAFHFASAYGKGPATNWGGRTSEYYALLTDAFLAGRTSLQVEPDPELLALSNPYDPVANAHYRLNDASLYGGKYYLYFGPAPAIVLFVPYKVLTGSHLPPRVAVALFCIAGFACSCALFFLLVKREKWVCPFWLAETAVLSLGTSSIVFFLLVRPSFYEVAISSGYCFLMGGFLLTAYSLGPRPAWWPGLVMAGICFGLAAGSRPHFALVAALMTVLVSFRLRRHKSRVLAFAGPIFLCGAILACYNYQRFQNPFEFGTSYLVGVYSLGSLFGLEKVVPGIYYFLFSPPWVSLQPPFVSLHAGGFPFGRLPGSVILEPVMGLMWAAPIALIGLCTPFVLWNRQAREFIKPGPARFTIQALYASAVITLALFVLLGWIVGRYGVDFAPELVLLSWCLLAASWQAVHGMRGSRPLLFKGVVTALTLYTVLLDFWICLQQSPR
jgi:hypothetical protein